jgi:hypothetical protein
LWYHLQDIRGVNDDSFHCFKSYFFKDDFDFWGTESWEGKGPVKGGLVKR